MSQHIVHIIKAVLYAVIAICSLIIMGALGVSMVEQDQNCLLYANVKGSFYYYTGKSPCDYSIAVAAIFCLLFPIIIIVLTILSFRGVISNKLFSTDGLPFLILVAWDALSVIFVLVAACIITVGTKTVCDGFIKGRDISCAFFPLRSRSKEIYFFYESLAVAAGGAWSAFVVYLAHLLIGLLMLWKEKRQARPSNPNVVEHF